MVHDLSPFIFKFSDDFGLRWYGFSYVLGFVFSYFIIVWLTKRQRTGMTVSQVGDMITYAAFGTLIGGRLGYVLFYSPDLLWKFKSAFPFWGVFAVNEGGMASHGGMIGIVIALWLFSRNAGLPFLYVLDLSCLAGPVGVFFGRIANFINGELVGRPAPADFPLAVKFPQDILMWPTQDFERLKSLGSAVEQVGLTKTQWGEWLEKYPTDTSLHEPVYSALTKIVTGIQDGNSTLKNLMEPILTPRHPSQLYAAFGEGLLIFLVLFFLWRSPRKPGFICSTFILLYALVRIGDEFFRMPDAAIGFQLFGLTRGQWLSIVMAMIGVFLMFWWGKSGSMTIAGWGHRRSMKIGRR